MKFVQASKSAFFCEGTNTSKYDAQHEQPKNLTAGVRDSHRDTAIPEYPARADKRPSSTLHYHPVQTNKVSVPSSHRGATIPEYSARADKRSPSTNRHQAVETYNASAPKTQPSLFHDDLEAAADIVKWEQEQLASEDPLSVHEISPEQYAEVESVNNWEAQKPKSSNCAKLLFSIEEELAAAAEIAHWEEKQRQQSAIADEIAAAAEIAQWEDDQAANGALHENRRALSDEIAAAADIVDWELAHQCGKVATVFRIMMHLKRAHIILFPEMDAGLNPGVSAIVIGDDDPEHDRPQFQLLGTTPAARQTSHASVVTPIHAPSCQLGVQKQIPRTPPTTSHKRKNEPAKKCEFITQLCLLTLISLLLQH